MKITDRSVLSSHFSTECICLYVWHPNSALVDLRFQGCGSSTLIRQLCDTTAVEWLLRTFAFANIIVFSWVSSETNYPETIIINNNKKNQGVAPHHFKFAITCWNIKMDIKEYWKMSFMWHTTLLIHRLQGQRLWWVCGDAFDGELEDTNTSLDLSHLLRWTQLWQHNTSVNECWNSSCLCEWVSVHFNDVWCHTTVSTGCFHGPKPSGQHRSLSQCHLIISVGLLCFQCGGSFQIHLRLSLSVTLIGTHSWLTIITRRRPVPAIDSHNSQPEKRNSSALSACRHLRFHLCSYLPRTLSASAKLPGAPEWSFRIMTYTNAVLRLMVASV